MSVNAVVSDGKLIDPGSTKSSNTVTGTKSREVEAKSGYDQDAFMNILCAQMKYQDPLEPTSNTEYISQYAQFTQVEQMQNMAKAMSMSRASELVGKTVMVESTNSKGEIERVEGRVDYVTYSGSDAYLNIDGKDYKMEDVKSVADSVYISEHEAADELMNNIAKLPSLNSVTLDDLDKIRNLVQTYEAMNDRTKSYVDNDAVTELKKYSDRVTELYEDDAENEEKWEELLRDQIADTEKAENTGETPTAAAATAATAATAETDAANSSEEADEGSSYDAVANKL